MKLLLYGLQRTGTNIIDDYIRNVFGVTFSNKNFSKYQSNIKKPPHKHFRLEDINFKEFDLTIKKMMNYDTIDECKYIIMIKDIYSWLISIKKWNLRWNPKNSRKTMNKENIDDYKLFYNKWYSFYKENSNKILFINYHNFITNTNKVKDDISKFLNISPNTNTHIINKKINWSGEFTNEKKKYYTDRLYLNEYTLEDKKNCVK